MTIVALTLVAPRTFEEKLTQLLLEHDRAGAAGFTIRETLAYGRTLDLQTVSERIGGRVRQIELRLLLPADDVSPFVEWLRSAVRDRNVTWQVAPLSATGDLG